MWTGSICDEEIARKSAGSALAGQEILGVSASALSSVAAAQVAATTAEATMSICDRIWATPVRRGYKVASNMGGSFASSYATLYNSLPLTYGHPRNMINGG